MDDQRVTRLIQAYAQIHKQSWGNNSREIRSINFTGIYIGDIRNGKSNWTLGRGNLLVRENGIGRFFCTFEQRKKWDSFSFFFFFFFVSREQVTSLKEIIGEIIIVLFNEDHNTRENVISESVQMIQKGRILQRKIRDT